MWSFRIIFVAPVLLASISACQDLVVVNENLPNTERALREAPEVEAVIRSSFAIWRNPLNNGDMGRYLPITAGELASTLIVRQVQPSFEPRQPLNNDPVADEVWIPRSPWDQFSSALANAVDGLHRILDDGLVINTPDANGVVTDNTNRARIFAKVWEGISLGYLGLVFDQNARYTHEEHLPEGYDALVQWEVDHLRPYPEIITTAVAVLEDAIADLDASPSFTLPADWMSVERTSAELRQIANSFIARLLVYSTRTPEERAAVNWQKVLAATEAGLTFDFNVTLGPTPGVGNSGHLQRMQETTNNSRGHRASYRWIGVADTSGTYQTWLATPLESRNRFDLQTPDRRITGPTPTTDGAYFRYRTDDLAFDASRGTYNFSAYGWYRTRGQTNVNTATWTIMSADENRLLRAEALLRTNDLAGAAELINVSRTRPVTIAGVSYPGLPSVTADGVPQATGCVPRNGATGACGTLLEALIYEREIEAGGWDPIRTWADRRGLGTLLPGTILHLAIPGRYLTSMGLPIYSFGGVGGPGAAQ